MAQNFLSALLGGGAFGSNAGSNFLMGSQSQLKPFNKQSLQSLLNMIQGGGGLQNNSLYNSGGSYLQNILSGNPEAFSAFEAPFKQQFEQQIVPGIAERFAGMGTGGGASSSSGLNNSLAQAGKDLSTNLAGLRSGLQMQAAGQGLNYAQQPISNQLNAFSQLQGQYYDQPGQQGALGPLLMALAKAFGGGGF